jgi:hypothetical protein
MRRKTNLVLNVLAVWGLVCWLGGNFFAQAPKQDRIVGPIGESSPVWLHGNIRPMFQPENDQGPVADSLKLENITLTFKPTEEQQANLTALLAEQQDPSSPLYHLWLTPEQYAESFGLSANDVAAVVAWLQAQGFSGIQTARSRRWVSFSGTAAQVQSTFHAEIHNYSVDGQTYYGPASEPAVPAALADVVQGLGSLDNYHLKPRGVFRHVKADAEPDFTSYLSGNNFVAPGDFATIYDVNALYSSTPAIDGTGVSIAVMGQTALYSGGSDITAFRLAAGLPANSPTMVLATGSSNPGVRSGDIDEASLDVEWAGAVAKNANIIFVYSTDVLSSSLPYAVDNKIAPVISISYGACEAQWGSSDLNNLVQLATQANSQGQTIVVAAGDSGAADCDYSTSTSIVYSATHGLAVDLPAALPYVTGMGGAEFNEGAGNYWKTAPTVDVLTSALSYIPEKVWNDTSTTYGLLAGGGGASTIYSRPSWQTGSGVFSSDGKRDIPDVSLNASNVHEGLLVCVQGSCVNGFRLSATNATNPNGLTVAGGTSAAAPTFAGIVALIVQSTGSWQGNINPTLYSMAATSPAAFHDITTGNNIVPCTSGSTGCPSGGQIGYSAGVGYDQASGLGSVDAYNLVMAWGSSGAGNLPAPTLNTPTNGLTGASVTPTFTWTTVTGAAGYRILVATSPTLLTTNPAVTTCSGCTILDTTTATSYTPTTALAAATLYYWQVQAEEPSTSSGTAAWSGAFVFNTGTPDFSLSASPTSLTLSPGSSGTSTLTLTPVGGFLPANATLSCSVSSTLAGVTCAVGSLSGNGTATVTITASSSATTFPAPPQGPRFGGRWVAGITMLCLLLIALLKLRQGSAQPHLWNLRSVALGAVLVAILVASLSCGGGNSSSGGGGGGTTPPPESGTVTVTGSSSGITPRTATINVSVT